MICPQCSQKTGVINSRPYDEGKTIYRRRRCYSCKFIYSTWEISEEERDKINKVIQSSHKFQKAKALIDSVFEEIINDN